MIRPAKSKIKVAVMQRNSLVALDVFSLSVSVRIIEALDYLESKSVVEYVIFGEDDPNAEKIIDWAQIILLNKHSSLRAFELVQYASGLNTPIIYDVDDWIFSFPEYSGHGLNQSANFTLDIIGLSNVVTVANDELLKRVPEEIPGITPVLVPNGIWVERHVEHLKTFEDVKPESNQILFTNADFLKVKNAKSEILTALQVFFKNHPEYTLNFFGDPFPEMFSLPFLHFTKRMSYVEYMNCIIAGGYKFAICPLGGKEDEDSSQFNACKNPFKYINYGVARIPCIYSKSDIYMNSVTDLETGLLVDNNYDSWSNALELLSSDAGLRNRIGLNSYEDIQLKYHIKDGAKILFNEIRKLLN